MSRRVKTIVLILSSGLICSLLFFSLKYNWDFSFIFRDIMYFPITIMSKNNAWNFENVDIEKNKELENLKQILEINNTLTDFKCINATVINRNTSYWHNELVINKGSRDGIKKDMAVMDGQGLIGSITKVSLTTSTIKLITGNFNNKISVKILTSGKSINKILEHDKDNNLVISGIDNNFKINIGDAVVTSGLSNIYPAGITIGTIKKMEDDRYGVSKKIYIKPIGDFDNIRFVVVLNRSV
jgi:rod shape-determining protein MreC